MDSKRATNESLSDELRLFNVSRYAVLVDDSVDPAQIEPLMDARCVGLFTFTLDAAAVPLHGRCVHLLDRDAALPSCDGWILGTASKACYALNYTLHNAGREREIILPLVTDRFARMFSYVDFFKGETETAVYVHNIFERAYKIPYPIALRYVLRSNTGEVMAASQRLLAANYTTVFNSADFDVSEPFSGYLELHADVRYLNGEVSAFLHLNCDYVSADAMTTVHSSGFGPWPAGSRFGRGIMPTEPGRRLAVSMFNRSNAAAIHSKAELRATAQGQRISVTRDLPPVPPGHMVFADVSGVFAPELREGVTAADVLVIPDRPMHRPNFYYHRHDRMWSWDSVEHSAAPVEQVLPAARRDRLRQLGCHVWVCPLPILPEGQGLDTMLYYFEDGPARLHDFRLRAYDLNGRCRLESEEKIPFGGTLNVSQWLETHGGGADYGLCTLVPSDRAPEVPDTYQILGGFSSRRNPGPPATLLAGVVLMNFPVEVNRVNGWPHPRLPIVHTEIFGKARVGPDYDTTVVLYNVSPFDRYDRTARIELDIVTWDGRSTKFYESIPPNGSISLSIGDLLNEARIQSTRDYYSLWVYCRECYVYGYHIVRRRRDDALGIEHFYYSRFNVAEP